MGIETGFFVGAVILGLAIAYGAFRYSRRNPANQPITDAATREEYKDTDRYAQQGTDDKLRQKVEPS